MYPYLTLGTTAVSTYFLVISLAVTLGCLWFIHRAGQRGLQKVAAIDMAMVCLVGGFVGARLLHVIWEEPLLYRANPRLIYQVWNGGFVFYGGVIGAFIATSFFANLRKEPFWLWADLAAPAISLTYFFGRIACFLNGCCYGKYCQLSWAIGGRHPTQLYAAFWELGVLALVLYFDKRSRQVGQVFGIWLFGHALGRAVMELYRDDPRGDLIYGVSLGSIISLALGIFGATLALSKFERPR
jgi:phosphatidylglycerol---prolipoprotein diacylglyceryl transferase